MNRPVKILLIEDDLADAELIKEMLLPESAGKFDIRCVERLSDLTELINNSDFDVVLVDLGLPDSKGLETFRKVNEMTPGVPVIVLTGLSDDDLGNQTVQYGAQDYLIKGEVNDTLLKRSITYAIERKRAEEKIKKSEIKFRELSEQLSETNNLKDLLLDVISHDLRNTAGVIFGFADLLKSKEDQNEIYDNIYNAAESLLKVIENASTLAKLSYGEKIIFETIDIDKIIKEVIKEFQPSGIVHFMKIEYDSHGKLPVSANPIISEIFKNYLSNAIKYGLEGELIIVEAYIQKELFVFKVTDYGKTIPTEKRELIFERLIRLDKEKHEGFGLGLAIVKRIADAHGGKVWVEPNQPQGNIFYFTMPVGS